MKVVVTRIQTASGQRPGSEEHLPAGVTKPFIDVARAKVHSAEDMLVCVRTFSATDVPGYDERLDFECGRSWITSDHPAASAYPANFAADGSKEALRARGYKPSRAERVVGRRKAKSKNPPGPREHVVTRSASSRPTPPWRLEEREVPRADFHTRRPRAVTGDDIYDLSTVPGSIIDPGPAAREMRDRAMRSLERARFAHARADQDAIRGHIAKTIDAFEPEDFRFTKHLLRTGAPDFRKLFAKFMRGSMLSDDEARALSLTDHMTGKAVVPYSLDPSITQTSSPRINPLRAISRTEVTMTDEWRGVGSEGIEAGYRSEGSESTDDAPAFSPLKVNTEGASAWIPWSFEIGGDWGAMEPQIAAVLQRSKDDLEAVKFWTGSGEDEPYGLLTLLTKLVESKEEGKLLADDIEALEAALPDGFLDAATWVGHRDTFAIIRGLEGVDWVKHPGVLPELNGTTAMALSTADADLEPESKPLVVGDFQQFVIADRIGMELRRIPHVMKNGRPTGEGGFYALWRNGTTVAGDDAFRVLVAKEGE